ncbi:Hypothetical protein, putative [Bodo saltans]|uniref:Rubicon Homology domain-containing protein n=1 Tax=Bodo saltans TaxID=75058 RepID=A0A0S4ISE7_BODSA|nr:Hypothetical protein, putative [Bodo saltans]|eukprot:CUG05835.1 Hypothetical protein, putative [Bodo saltans]
MATQYARESVNSRLSPFRQAIEELNCRREDGFNHFTSDEPAVGRLLNALDMIFNTDVEHPGEFFDFIKCALESIPRQAIIHQPLEQVVARNIEDRVENFRLWLIYSLNLTGSLKHSLHAALPMRDVLSCFVNKSSILFRDSFTDEFLGSLATLHNPPIGDGQTTFKLDPNALSLFEERPIPVMLQTKGRGGGGAGGVGGGRASVIPTKGRATIHSDATTAPSAGVTGKVKRVERRRQVAERSSQTADVAFAAPSPAAEVVAVVATAPTAAAATSSSSKQATVSTADNATNTDHPSPLMSFQELMEAQQSIETTKAEQRAMCESLRQQESEAEETKREYLERMEIVVATIRQLKSLYNELFMRSLEAQDTMATLSESDVDARIVDVFYACKHGTGSATRDAIHEAVIDSRPGADGRRKRADATTSHRPSDLSPVVSPRITVEPVSTSTTNNNSDVNASRNSATPSQAQAPGQRKEVATPTTATLRTPTSATTSSMMSEVAPPPAATAVKKSAVPPPTRPGTSASPGATPSATSSLINSHHLELEVSTTSPLASDALIPVENTKLILTEPTEFDRPQQLELQANRCASCGTSFGDAGDKNLVLKVVQKAGETLRLQKPRRCHYCVRLFCHRCHANKMAVLPFRVLQRWDFSPQHVCNRDFEFLNKNQDRAFYALPSLPHELQIRPNVQQAAFLRKKLVLLCKILMQCSHDKAAPFSAFLHTHYAQREHFYSLGDFGKLRGGEGNRLMMAAATPINAMGTLVGSLGGHDGAKQAQQGGPGPNEDLVSFLTTMFTKAMQHVKECRQCIARSSMKCGLCTESSPVSLVDDDSQQCKTCLSIYHVSCMDISHRCPSCSKK